MNGARVFRIALAILALVLVPLTPASAAPKAAAATAPRAAGSPMSRVLAVRAPQPKAACVPLVPVATPSPAGITFPAQVKDSTSEAILTITNTGNATLLISDLVVNDTDSFLCDCTIFSFNPQPSPTPCVGVPIAPGGSCTQAVRFNAAGNPGQVHPGSIDIVSNAAPVSVPLSGAVGVIGMTASTPLLDFGGVAQSTSTTRSFSIQNTGNIPLDVQNVSLFDPNAVYSLLGSGTCPATVPFSLATGASCTFDVQFAPTGNAIYFGGVSVGYGNSFGLISSVFVALNGIGVAAGGLIDVSPPAVFLGNQFSNTSSSTSIVLTNTASTPSPLISSVLATGTGLSITADSCSGLSLPPAGSCAFEVTAARGGLVGGLYAGTVTPVGVLDGAGLQVTLPVTFGVTPQLFWNPLSFDFGNVAFGSTVSQTFTLENFETIPVGITAPIFNFTAPAGRWVIAANTCGSSVPAAIGATPGTCSVTVTLSPQAGDFPFFSAGISVTESATLSDVFLSLAGQASGPSLTGTNTSANFGSGAVGTPSTQTVTVTNIGNQASGPLVFTPPTFANTDFTIANNTCGAGVGVGASCTFDVVYSRATPGFQSDFINVSTSPAVFFAVTVSVSGTATTALPGVLEVFPVGAVTTPVTFPGTLLNVNSAPIDISVGNTGGLPLDVTSVTITGDFTFVENCTTPSPTLAPGACCTVTVTFRPTVTGTRAGALTIVDSVTGLPKVINLAGVGLAPAAPTVGKVFSPNPILTGGVSTLTVSISNSNAIPLTNAAFTDTFPAGLVVAPAPAIANTCGGTATAVAGGTSLALAGGTIPAATTGPGVCSVSVAVTAAAASPGLTNTIPAGGFTTAEANSTAAATAILVVTNAPVPSVSLTPTSLAFGSQTLFIASAPQTVTLQNVGTAPLNVASVTASGDFTASSTCVGAPIAPGNQCVITSSFTPIVAGLRTGQIGVTSDAPGSPHIVTLSGTGVAPLFPNVVLAPTSVIFPTTTAGQASAPLAVTLTNSGLATLAIQAIDVIGTGFRLSLNTCGVSVASGASCTLQFVFQPPSAGSFLADVRIITNSPASPTFLRLTGSGAQAPQGRLTAPAQIAFNDQIVNTSSAPSQFTISNQGAATLSISRMAATGDFVLDGLCFDLRAGESCVAAVRFAPTVIGTRTGQVVIESNASNPIVGISLSGRGVPIPAPQVSLSATSLSYGNTLQGTGGTLPVTLTNTGGADLAIGSIVALGDYRVSSDCPALVPPGRSCRLDIGFAPSLPGERTGEVRISSNAASSPDSVRLSGVGCSFFTVPGGRSGSLICSR